jgi:hypothetical protein
MRPQERSSLGEAIDTAIRAGRPSVAGPRRQCDDQAIRAVLACDRGTSANASRRGYPGLQFIDADVEEGAIELAFSPTEDSTNPTGNVLGALVAAMLYDTVGASPARHPRA